MPLPRLAGLPLLLVLGVALVGCDSEEADAGGGTRIEDLGSEVLYVVGGVEPFTHFEGDSGAFLERLGFVPVYPRVLPQQYRRSSASMSADPAGGEDQTVALSLQYLMDAAGSDLITVGQFMGDRLPNPGMSSEAVDIGGVEGWLIYPDETEAFVLAWHSCDRVISIQSDAIDVEQAITMAESVECPDPDA